MRYKNQNDIDWVRFNRFCESIDGLSPEDIEAETMREWFPNEPYSFERILEFMKALETHSDFDYKLDMIFKSADRFIDADTYLTGNYKLQLAQMIIKPKHRFQKIKFTVSSVNYACLAFEKYAEPIKEKHPWIYNPPILPTTGKHQNTIGGEYMKEFVQHYGAYMEIIYLLTKGDLSKMDEITDWSVERFLFQGEYLLRKKRIENII
jgi:hypothetical protein